MAEFVRARAMYSGDTGKFIKGTFHNIKIKQIDWNFKVKEEMDNSKDAVITYSNFEEFISNWEICAKLI